MHSLLLGVLLNDTHSDSLSVVSLFLLDCGFNSSSLPLLFELLFSDFFLFHFVDGLNQDRLVFELVTLGSQIEMMVDILGDFLGLSIFLEKSSKNSLSSHPKDLRGHSCVFGSLPLTMSVVSSFSFGFMHSLAS